MNHILRLAAAMLLTLVTACSENDEIAENGTNLASIPSNSNAFTDVSDLDNHPLSPWLKQGGSLALRWAFRTIPSRCIYTNNVVNIDSSEDCQRAFEAAAQRLNKESVLDNVKPEQLQVASLYQVYQLIKEAETTERQTLLNELEETDSGDAKRDQLNEELINLSQLRPELLGTLKKDTTTDPFLRSVMDDIENKKNEDDESNTSSTRSFNDSEKQFRRRSEDRDKPSSGRPE